MRKKVRITTLNNNEKTIHDITALVRDNTIVYIEKDSKKTKVYFNYDKNQLIRENKELSMCYNFDLEKETMGKLLVYGLQKSLTLRIKTNTIIREGYNIELKFTVEKEPIEYKIEVIK